MRLSTWLGLLVGLAWTAQGAAQDTTWICRIKNESMNGWRPLAAQSPHPGAQRMVPTNMGDVFGVQQHINS